MGLPLAMQPDLWIHAGCAGTLVVALGIIGSFCKICELLCQYECHHPCRCDAGAVVWGIMIAIEEVGL